MKLSVSNVGAYLTSCSATKEIREALIALTGSTLLDKEYLFLVRSAVNSKPEWTGYRILSSLHPKSINYADIPVTDEAVAAQLNEKTGHPPGDTNGPERLRQAIIGITARDVYNRLLHKLPAHVRNAAIHSIN